MMQPVFFNKKIKTKAKNKNEKNLKKGVDKSDPSCYYVAVVRTTTKYARVVELVDSLDSGSSAHSGHAGSSPASRTKKERHAFACLSFL